MSLALSLSSLAVSLTACAGAAVFAVKARAMRIEAETKFARAIRLTREQLITGHLESNGGCARLVVDDPTGRPTHPDGTPYRYSEITAEGWEHCDGCQSWGKWTAEEPHDCSGPFIKGPISVRPLTSPAETGAEVDRILDRLRRHGI